MNVRISARGSVLNSALNIFKSKILACGKRHFKSVTFHYLFNCYTMYIVHVFLITNDGLCLSF